MFKFISTFLFLLAFSHACFSEYYKVIDENGKVTYTERPPQDPSKASQVEEMKIGVTANYRASVKKVGAMEYCGELELPNIYMNSNLSYYTQYSNVRVEDDGRTIRLPREESRPVRSYTSRLLERIVSQRRTWQKKLERLENTIEEKNRILFEQNARKSKYRTLSASDHRHRNTLKNDINEKLNQVRELRCAVNWADEQKEKIDQENATNVKEIQRLEEIISKLEEKMFRICGAKPIFDPSQYMNNEYNDAWIKCANPHLSDIYKVENRIRAHMNGYKETQY